jgi:hypothetical protein
VRFDPGGQKDCFYGVYVRLNVIGSHGTNHYIKRKTRRILAEESPFSVNRSQLASVFLTNFSCKETEEIA